MHLKTKEKNNAGLSNKALARANKAREKGKVKRR